MDIVMTILSFWWVALLIVAVVSYKFILRVFFGMVIIPEDKVGLVTKKFVLFGAKKSLPDGKIIALEGESGMQADPLAPGLYWGFWIWQYDVIAQSFIEIPRGKIGLVNAKDGNELPTGHMLARKVECENFSNARQFLTSGGQKGKQVDYLTTGVYRINTLLFEVAITDITVIEEGKVGIITALDGLPLTKGSIAGKDDVEGHNNFQDFDKFLGNGGQRGLQPQVIQAGSYTLNPWAVLIEKVNMTEIPIGHVGVVISYTGEEGRDLTGEGFKHGNIVSKGQRGVWATAYDPGKYPINPYIMKVELVPTTNLVLNWANSRNESHNLDSKLCTITVRSKDGFPFNLDVSQIIHIPSTEAPKVIARFGSMMNLVSQVLQPLIGNYFRNSAQNSDILQFLSDRTKRQNDAKNAITNALQEYNINAVDTLIGDINPPEELMKTLTDRKIAEEQEITFQTQQKTEDQRKTLESAKALANMQGQMVVAQQSVEISQRQAEVEVKKSEGEARAIEIRAKAESNATVLIAEAESKKIKSIGEAEAVKIEAVGKSTAEAYKLQVEAMGINQFGNLKIIEQIGINNVKIIPDIMINGNGENANPITGLLGFELLKQFQNKQSE